MRLRSDTLAKAALLLGFVGVSIATVGAYRNPVTGYELSIYQGTPLTFWVGTSVALLVSLLVVFSEATRRVRFSGAFLGGLTMTAVASLPISRGYYWVGEADSLSHLGTTLEMSIGVRALTNSRYPIVHTLGTVLQDATGLALHHTLLLIVVVFVISFFVFVPLVVGELTDNVWATSAGLFSGFLLLPINQLSPSMYIHPTSQALMFTPVFLFVFFRLFYRRSIRHVVLFLLLAVMYVLLHPQQAANLVAFFGTIAVLQIGYDVFNGHRLNRVSEWVIPEVTFFAAVFWLWANNIPVYQRNLERVFQTLSGNTQFAASTASRSVSLSQVGGSLPEVFVKLFLVSLVYVGLTGLLAVVVVSRLRWFSSRTRHAHGGVASNGGTVRIPLLFVFCGLVPVTLIFLTYLVGGISDQYFRHLGMLMVFATILGAITLTFAAQYVSRRWKSSIARRLTVLVFVLFIALSIPVVFASPYIYYTSNHVTEAQVSGYETTFEHRANTIQFDEVRSTVYRYGHAIQGSSALAEDAYYQKVPRGIPDHFVNRSLRSYYDERVYVPITEADRVRDPVLWKGFRFNHEDFEYLETEPGIDKVQTNGGYDLYLVEPAENPVNESSN